MTDIFNISFSFWNILYIISVIGAVLYYGNILRKIAKKIHENARITHDKNIPPYVSMGNDLSTRGTEMRLRYTEDSYIHPAKLEYWRDGGEWGIEFRWEQRGLFKRVLVTDASGYSDEMAERLDGVLLTPISKEKYEDGNKGYLPDNYEIEANLVNYDLFDVGDNEIAF